MRIETFLFHFCCRTAAQLLSCDRLYASYYEKGEVIAEVLRIDRRDKHTVNIIAKRITGGHTGTPDADFSYYIFPDKRKAVFPLPDNRPANSTVLLAYTLTDNPDSSGNLNWQFVKVIPKDSPLDNPPVMEQWYGKDAFLREFVSEEPFRVNSVPGKYTALTHTQTRDQLKSHGKKHEKAFFLRLFYF